MLSNKEWYNKIYLKNNLFCYREWIFRPYIGSLIAQAGLKCGSTILDIGCGQGFFSYLFHKFGMRVFGVDISEAGIKMAQSYYGSLDIVFVVGDVLTIPFSQKFDCVFTRSCSLYNSADFLIRHEITDRLFGYVKDGGTFIFAYNTNFKPLKKCKSWRYHTLSDVTKHFSRYSNAEIFFISKIDTLLIGKYSFNLFFTKLNILLSKVFGIGGDIVCIFKKG